MKVSYTEIKSFFYNLIIENILLIKDIFIPKQKIQTVRVVHKSFIEKINHRKGF